jgi:hypothetical protein
VVLIHVVQHPFLFPAAEDVDTYICIVLGPELAIMSTFATPHVVPASTTTLSSTQTHVMAGVLIAVAGATLLDKIRTKRKQRYSRIEESRRHSRAAQSQKTESIVKVDVAEHVTEVDNELPPYEQYFTERSSSFIASPPSPAPRTVELSPVSSPPPYRLTTTDEFRLNDSQPSTPVDKKRKSIEINLKRLSSSLKFTTPDILAGVSAAHGSRNLLPWTP